VRLLPDALGRVSPFLLHCDRAVQIIEKDYKVVIVRPVIGHAELGTVMLVAEVWYRACLRSCFLKASISQELGMLNGDWAWLGTTVSGSLGSLAVLCVRSDSHSPSGSTPRAVRDRLYRGFITLQYA
jgi:hypothetical protein